MTYFLDITFILDLLHVDEYILMRSPDTRFDALHSNLNNTNLKASAHTIRQFTVVHDTTKTNLRNMSRAICIEKEENKNNYNTNSNKF